jgi:predicted GNAT family N-acyltransferase
MLGLIKQVYGITMEYEIKIIPYHKDMHSIKCIREKVFIKEQNIAVNIEFDGLDDEAFHAVVYHKKEVIGTGRLLKEGRIGRVAVLSAFRKKGFGVKIIRALIDQARQLGLKKVYLDAQVDTMSFYQKLGFSAFNDSFMKANILHQPMQMCLY